jgi:phage replication O-like protein O
MSIESPQLEDGFTPIANAIMDALARTRFSGYERSVLDFLFRKTYGWSKKSDLISLSQFVDGTGILKPHVVRTIKRLVEKNVIHKTVAKIGNDNLVRYEFNKHWGTWQALPKLVMAHSSLPKMVPTISIGTTTSKRLEDKEGVSLGKAKRVKGIPTIGFEYEGGTWIGIDERHRNVWHLAYPSADLDVELAKMAGYLIDNPQKKYSNYGAFIRNWLSRSTGEAPMKKRSLESIGKKNMEEW